MTEKLNLYDILAGLAPGVLLTTWTAVLFPRVANTLKVTLPDAFAVIALLAVSLLAGVLVQTLGSLLEPVLYAAFGGRPSDLALQGRLSERYLPADASKRIKALLRARFGEGSDRSLFLRAMSEAEASETSKARIFNAQYGYLRSIAISTLIALLLLLCSRGAGHACSWTNGPFLTVVVGLILLVVLFSWRAWQRGCYYVREVLHSMERLAARPSEAATTPVQRTP